jgi:hypothetical protein
MRSSASQYVKAMASDVGQQARTGTKNKIEHTSPAAVAVAATCAEIGILGWQCGGFDPVDGICIRILRRDRTAALTFADKRTLWGACQRRATDKALGVGVDLP